MEYNRIIGSLCVACNTIYLVVMPKGLKADFIGTPTKCSVIQHNDYQCGAPMAELADSQINELFDSTVTPLEGENS